MMKFSQQRRQRLIEICLIGFLTRTVISFQTIGRPSSTFQHGYSHRYPFQLSSTQSDSSATAALASQPTELPDSLVDAAERAAESCAEFSKMAGPVSRCRVDFDTSAGDETFPLLKTSSEFMQNLVTFLSYKLIPGLQQVKLQQMQRVAEARATLQTIMEQEEQQQQSQEGTEEDDDASSSSVDLELKEQCIRILESNGRDDDNSAGESSSPNGPVVRVYFPDEGNAALARRDWAAANPDLPSCVQFSSCGGVQVQDISNDVLVFFFCPKASESEQVEELLTKTEEKASNLLLTVFVNPNLVDMGVTGFGMAGRMLRERLLDGLMGTYYLRTLAWGALTRSWPSAYSIWQEDTAADGGYRLIKTLGYLPSNPEVEDIYDAENSPGGGGGGQKGGSPLDQLGDFVQGMMRL